MFWIFKKKGTDHEAHKKIDKLNNSVSSSFKNLKRDMDNIGSWLDHLKDSDHVQNKKLENIENQLSQVLKQLESHNQTISSHSASLELVSPEESEEEESDESEIEAVNQEEFIADEKIDVKSIVSSLTDTQKQMFVKLLSLQRESGGWVSFKTLAEELYPGKQYSDVRSTISEYLALLMDWGLVTKKRTGKQSLVAVTEKGEQIIESLRVPRKAKLSIKRRN